MKKKKRDPRITGGRDYMAMKEFLAGAATPTPSKKGRLQKMERKHKGRQSQDYGSYFFVSFSIHSACILT